MVKSVIPVTGEDWHKSEFLQHPQTPKYLEMLEPEFHIKTKYHGNCPN